MNSDRPDVPPRGPAWPVRLLIALALLAAAAVVIGISLRIPVDCRTQGSRGYLYLVAGGLSGVGVATVTFGWRQRWWLYAGLSALAVFGTVAVLEGLRIAWTCAN